MSLSFIPDIRVDSRNLIDQTSLKFVVFLSFLFYLKKNENKIKNDVMEKHNKNKRLSMVAIFKKWIYLCSTRAFVFNFKE